MIYSLSKFTSIKSVTNSSLLVINRTSQVLLFSRLKSAFPADNNNSTMKSGTTQQLGLLRKYMKDLHHVPEPLAAYLVPSCDAHNSEYLAAVDARREYISGFTGSAGSAVITPKQALMWTDGRYYLQAQKEMDSNWVLMKDGLATTPKQIDWLVKNLEPGSVIGIDPLLVSSANWKAWSEQLETVGSRLHALDQNLVDLVWREDKQNPQPARPENPVFPLEYCFTGTSHCLLRILKRTIHEREHLILCTFQH